MKMRFVRIVLNCAIVLAVCSFAASCSDEDGEVSEYENWQERNDSYLLSIRTLALDSMRIAKSRYGNNWEEKCNWRSYLSYKFDATVPHNGNDSAYIQILRRGQGSEVSPYLNDSVRIFYRAHLIPSSSYPEGQVILHSGQSSLYNDIFNVKTGVPTTKTTTVTTKAVTEETKPKKDNTKAFLLNGLNFYGSPDEERKKMSRYSQLYEELYEDPGLPWELVVEYENVPYLGINCNSVLCFTSLGLVGINYFDENLSDVSKWQTELTQIYGNPDEIQYDYCVWKDAVGKNTMIYLFVLEDGLQISFYADDTGSEIS